MAIEDYTASGLTVKAAIQTLLVNDLTELFTNLAEVVAARDGESTLLVQINSLQALIATNITDIAANLATLATFGTAAVKDIGTAAGEIPLNSDLGTAAVKDIGTAAGEIPLNSDLGTAALLDSGINPGDVPLNSNDSINKGWINFDGTGTIAINDSLNVASITDGGVGVYSINWDTDFNAIDYAITVASDNPITYYGSKATDSIIVYIKEIAGALNDSADISVKAIGDQ